MFLMNSFLKTMSIMEVELLPYNACYVEQLPPLLRKRVLIPLILFVAECRAKSIRDVLHVTARFLV